MVGARSWPWVRWILWLVMLLPAARMTMLLFAGDVAGQTPVFQRLLHPTGEFAARFMIFAMMATPLRMLFPNARFIAGWMRYRRDLGVAAFLYALFHTVLYLAHKGTLDAVLVELFWLGIWTGWVAMLIFLPLGFTSNRFSTQRLGKRWKALQRLVYLAALMTLAHWVFVENNVGPALVHFVPLALLEIYRVWYLVRRPGG